jgi:hypothetical protein
MSRLPRYHHDRGPAHFASDHERAARLRASEPLDYPAATQASITVTDLIWKATRVVGFYLFVQPPDTMAEAEATPTRLPMTLR